MLNRRHCPHTGVVNFFAEAEPFLSVGSVIRADGAAAPYHWRCYVGLEPGSGAALDLRTAERSLFNHYRELERAGGQADEEPAVAA